MMSAGLMRTALWTELLEALRSDYPEIKFDDKAPPAVRAVVCRNADYIAELCEKLDTQQEQPGD